MRKACLLAVSSLALVPGCGSSHSAQPPLRLCAIRMSGLGSLAYGGGLFAELPDGSLIVGASHTHHSKLEIVLRRVSPDCRVVRSFGKSGTETITVDHAQSGTIDAIRATQDGQLILAGSDGRNELVGRLEADGRLDRSFGGQGWSRFKPYVKNYGGMPTPLPRVATSISFGPSGSIFLGGNDDTAHCCTQDFVSKLAPDGGLVQDYGTADGSIVVPKLSGSYITEVDANADGSAYVFVEYEQSGCGYPVVLRLRFDGSLDRHFDAAMARTLKRVAPQRWDFTPTLVPGRAGAFALVGGFDRTCGPLSSNSPSLGLAVGITPSGRLDSSFGRSGETRFPASLFALDNPPAIRLPSGRIVAAGGSSSGRTKGLIVRFFSATGAAERPRTIPRSRLARHSGIVGLAPAPNGGAWVVFGSTKEIELIPVR
jgi:hypothetical protein